LKIQERVEGSIKILNISGRIDSRTAREFETHLKSAISDMSPHLLLDMKDVEYITSAGMRVLASAYKAVSKFEGGDIVIANLREDLVRLFRLIGFDGLFTLYDDIETALRGMRSAAGQQDADGVD